MLTSHPGFALRLCMRVRMRVRIRRSDSLAEHIDFCSDKCHKCSENVRCPTVISSSACVTMIVKLLSAESLYISVIYAHIYRIAGNFRGVQFSRFRG